MRVAFLALAAIAAVVGPLAAGAATKTKTAGTEKPEDSVQKAVDRFEKSHSGTKADEAMAQILAHVGEQVPAFAPGGANSDKWLESIRAIATNLSGSGDPPERQTLKKIKNSKSPAEDRAFPLPSELRYRFGYRDLGPVDAGARDAKRVISALRAGKGLQPTDLTPGTRLEALMRGAVPEVEIAIAWIERDLDVDKSADDFQKFLENWRNGGPHGDEGFYEALDRTAGTGEEVFFFDAMLADFVGHFGGEDGKRWSLATQHDYNQKAFLTVRQYRGMIEATAYALTLPPEVKLPSRLKRYDYGTFVFGKFSYRDELDLLLEEAGGDARKVEEFVKKFLSEHPMPPKLWDAYDPLADFHVAREQKVADLVVRKQISAEALTKVVQDQRTALCSKIKAAAAAAAEATP